MKNKRLRTSTMNYEVCTLFYFLLFKKEFRKNFYMKYRNLVFLVEKNGHSGLFTNIHCK